MPTRRVSRAIVAGAAVAAAYLVTAAPAAAQGDPPAASRPSTGILLLAHGGGAQWNQNVAELAAAIDRERPVEVAFGMATRRTIQEGIDRLVRRGATEIAAVPLFVSSWSSVIRSTEYLLGLRDQAPRDLALFAKMDHAHGAADHPVAASAPGGDPTSPVVSPVPVHITPALNRHQLVGRILGDRAAAISTAPAAEAVVLVAHGPTPDEDNDRWLEDMAALAVHVRGAAPYAAVHYLTVRDDAGTDMRDRATGELRGIVEREIAAGRRVLIVPHLLSFGGIEKGIQKRLEGLAYTMAPQAIIPDPRIREWVLEQARTAGPVRPR